MITEPTAVMRIKSRRKASALRRILAGGIGPSFEKTEFSRLSALGIAALLLCGSRDSFSWELMSIVPL
jgi:hypothetical protein